MQKVIDGKVYDTEAAKPVAAHKVKFAPMDEDEADDEFAPLRDCEETLYVTANKRWFLAGSGGPMTRWAVPVPNRGANMTKGSEGILALSELEARRWAEENGVDVETIKKYFKTEPA